MLPDSSAILSLQQPKPNGIAGTLMCLPPTRPHAGTFRARILSLLEEHERLELEHYQLQNLLHSQPREGAEKVIIQDASTRSVPRERHDNDPLPNPSSRAPSLVATEEGRSSHFSTIGSMSVEHVGSNHTAEKNLRFLEDNNVADESSESPRPGSPTSPSAGQRHSQMTTGGKRHSQMTTHSRVHDLQRDVLNTIKHTVRPGHKQSIFGSETASSFGGRRAANIVKSRYFEGVVGVVIFANVMYMGWAADYMIKHPAEKETFPMKVMNLVFCIIYTCEVLLRLSHLGRRFFLADDRAWNIFDLALVVQSQFEEISYWSGLAAASLGSVSFLRAMRLLKLAKMLRIVRLMRQFREMRLIVFSIMGSTKGMFWSLILLLAVLFMFALVFVQACADHLADGSGEHVDPQIKKDLYEYFGSVHLAMSTLFLVTTGGTDWIAVALPLADISEIYYSLFELFIAFYCFVLMNTITALFVETTFSHSTRDHAYTIQTVLTKKAEYVDLLKLLFFEADVDGDGLIDDAEFCAKLGDPKMRAFAESLDIEISDAKHFFDLITDFGRKRIDLETFVVACIKMKGQAQSIDLQDLIMRQRRHNNDQEDINRRLRDNLAGLQTEFRSFRSSTEAHGSLPLGSRSSARSNSPRGGGVSYE